MEVLFKEARKRRQRRWIGGTCLIVLAIVATFVDLTVSGEAPPSPGSAAQNDHSRVPEGSAAAQGRVNLDVLTAQSQMTATVLGIRVVRGSIRPAAPADGAAVAFPRAGYVVGDAMGQDQSIADDLHSSLHTWTTSEGQYPAPANNPADIWLSYPGGQLGRAQEYDGRGRPVSAPVQIPAGWGWIVVGQAGPNLLLQSPAPHQTLELWDSTKDRVVATLGAFDAEASTPSVVAWTRGNVLHLGTSAGAPLSSFVGPYGDRASSLSFSPNANQIAVVWSPSPGVDEGASRVELASKDQLDLVRASSGVANLLPLGGRIVGPVAWAPDGNQIFYGQIDPSGASVDIATYDLANHQRAALGLSQADLPADFNSATGALIAWTR